VRGAAESSEMIPFAALRTDTTELFEVGSNPMIVSVIVKVSYLL